LFLEFPLENQYHQKLILSSYENGVQIDLFLSFVINLITSLLTDFLEKSHSIYLYFH